MRHVIWRRIVPIALIAFLIGSGGVFLWVATLKIPDLGAFDTYENKLLQESTKIYDTTGKVLLYNVNQDIRRSVVPFETISEDIKNATISIEDADFYNHNGIRPTAIIRATLVNILAGGFRQGGSTITQQVVKNSLLTADKKITRKIKEAILAMRVEQQLSKNEILNLYLNGTPYGGTMYGVEEASQGYFGKKSQDVTLAEAAYLAALPQAPSYFSPSGNHIDELEKRKNLVLKKMLEYKHITEAEYTAALAEKVVFIAPENRSLKAPHFVMFVLDYLNEKYGEEAVRNGNLRVTTTLDWELQKKGEEIVNKFALENVTRFTAENAALVAIDPANGHILTMVGSRDYFDATIDGNFNITTAYRQPGSSFKPFVYAAAFEKGYTPDTVLFDVPTEFNANCRLGDTGPNCYHPKNYDDLFRGPMTLRNALAQSINIPAVKTLYLVGITNALKKAAAMGITSLEGANRYGLTLVLGGGEVRLLDMTSAYGVFAAEGERNPYTAIVKIEDRSGKIIEEFKDKPVVVMDAQIAREISDVLSDNVARTPSYGAVSPLNFPNQDVAAKTGTTNDTRDAWILGYTPNIAVGAWAGNNDNRPMVKQVAGLIVAPLWRAFMDEALATRDKKAFTLPAQRNASKPVLNGQWQPGTRYLVDTRTNTPAQADVSSNYIDERVITSAHSILYWVDKNTPNGAYPTHPQRDPQFDNWEDGIARWFNQQVPQVQQIITSPILISPPPATSTPATTTRNRRRNNRD